MRSITQTLKVLLCVITTLFVFSVTSNAHVHAAAAAAATSTSTTGSVVCDDGKTADSLATCMQTCTYSLNGKPATKSIPQDQDCAILGGNCSVISDCDLIVKYIDPFIDFLSALVGVAVVISIIIGGIQYSSSGGDPGKASAAKERIRNAIVALLVYLFLFSILNFLIPGGLV